MNERFSASHQKNLGENLTFGLEVRREFVSEAIESLAKLVEMSVDYFHDFGCEFLELGEVEEFGEYGSLVQSLLTVLGKKSKFDWKLNRGDAD